jgi:hypothetical protein
LDRLTAQPLDRAGVPLGVIAGARYEVQRVAIRDGDVLVAYTDGVTEAENSAGEEFGVERLYEAIKDSLARPASGIVEEVRWRVRQFAGLISAQDDFTLVIVKVDWVGKGGPDRLCPDERTPAIGTALRSSIDTARPQVDANFDPASYVIDETTLLL